MWNRIKVWYSTYLNLSQFYSLKRSLTEETEEMRDSFDSESSTFDKQPPVRKLGIKVKVNKTIKLNRWRTIKFINKKVVHPKYLM